MYEVQSPMLSRRENPPHLSLVPNPANFCRKELPEQAAAEVLPEFRQTIVVSNRHGREEAFTIGPDGLVWSFFPDAVGALGFSGHRLVSLRMPADHLTVGRDAHGSLVVIAVKGLQVRYRVETSAPAGSQALGGPARWSGVEYAPLPPITGAVSVHRVYTQEDFGALRVAAIVDLERPDSGTARALAYCDWKESGPNVFKTVPALTLQA